MSTPKNTAGSSQSEKLASPDETIDKAQPRNNNELSQRGTISGMPGPDRKQELFDQLRHLLSLIDNALIDPDRPQFPNEVCEKLMITISDLQKYIGKKSIYRTPFWNCVKAVNHARPGLHLISRLNRLVARACRLPVSPLKKLEVLQQQKQLKADESGFVDEIRKAIDTYADDPVQADVVRWAPVLKRVNSRQCETKVKALGPNTSHIMGYLKVQDLVAYTGWLDFAYQYMKWRERVWPSLSSFLIVLAELENENYSRQVFSDSVPTTESMKKEMARWKAVQRQRRHRLRLKTKNCRNSAKNAP